LTPQRTLARNPYQLHRLLAELVDDLGREVLENLHLLGRQSLLDVVLFVKTFRHAVDLPLGIKPHPRPLLHVLFFLGFLTLPFPLPLLLVVESGLAAFLVARPPPPPILLQLLDPLLCHGPLIYVLLVPGLALFHQTGVLLQLIRRLS